MKFCDCGLRAGCRSGRSPGACGLSQGAISRYLSRARAAGLAWPLPEDLDDARLEALLFPPPSGTPADQRPMPDWAWVHRELRRPDVTLALLWEEYRAGVTDGFGYSWFCDLYRGWAGRLKPTMRQVHVAGEKLFVDFAGRTAEVIDAGTGEIIPVQIFVAVLGASSFTYAEAAWSQKLPDWIAAHVRAFAYFGGAARQTVSDNLKAGITKASFHEPMVNRTYADMARHYRTAIVPARPYKPRDKAKVEVGVQVVGRWILARLRHRRFFSLADLNAAIRALLDDLNNRPMRGWGVSRRALYEQLDRPALEPLPPSTLRIRRVEALPGRPRLPRRDRQALLQRAAPADPPGGRGADHRRDRRDLPPRQAGRQPSPQPPPASADAPSPTTCRVRTGAIATGPTSASAARPLSVGPDTAVLVDVILRSRPHPEQGFRSCIGILGLVKRFGAARVDAACARALVLGTRSYSSVAAILKNHREHAPPPTAEAPILIHENIRGPGYYH